MPLKKIHVKNFRLLYDVSLLLEQQTTVIVGRNNTGKTSLTEVVSRFLAEGNSTFALEDFSCISHDRFWQAFLAASIGAEDSEVRALLPTIEVSLVFEYDPTAELGTLADFVVDLDPGCTEAQVLLKYELEDGKISRLFEGITATDEESKPTFYRTIRERIPKLYVSTVLAVDPNDATNSRRLAKANLRAACANNCISAHRGLDDESSKERVVIGKVLENLFATAKANESDPVGHTLASDLEQAVTEIQDKIGVDFNAKLNELLPALALFGYPGLADPKIVTETTFDVERLLTNHTKVRYTGPNGVRLPESYNGLGSRNIILILLQLRQYFKQYCALQAKPAIHVVFVEEPEVHLHPQMQEVFIRKLGEIATKFSEEIGDGWPVQFVVSTHSSHVANEAHFEAIRYFVAIPHEDTGELKSAVKDLRGGLSGKPEPDRTFLHQYLTLTRCDLFFADKAILIEGTTERLLLPRVVRILDSEQIGGETLGTQYVSIVEVGGAYAHLFFDLLQFLELRTLIITDIDTVRRDEEKKRDTACPVHLGTHSSNACINAWFSDVTDQNRTPAELIAASEAEKLKGNLRIAFELPESEGEPCGRSFEDAFMLANPTLFPTEKTTADEKAIEAYANAKNVKKSDFALTHALAAEDWVVPKYIREGLLWLRSNPAAPIANEPAPATDLEPVAPEQVAEGAHA